VDEQLLELISVVYWHTNGHCGRDFDAQYCWGTDRGPCEHYEFCKAYDNIMREIYRKNKEGI